jgi:TPR repeat protein
MDLWKQAAELGSNDAHYHLGICYGEGGDLKKAKFHYEAAAMAGNDNARYNLGYDEYHAGNVERAVKHWKIAASSGHHKAMNNLIQLFKRGIGSRDPIDSILIEYNKSCVEMRSEARDAAIRFFTAKN